MCSPARPACCGNTTGHETEILALEGSVQREDSKTHKEGAVCEVAVRLPGALPAEHNAQMRHWP